MQTVSISVTEASRNFAECVNRVRYQGATFLLEKNGVPVAKIVPVERNAMYDSKFKSIEQEPAGERKPAGQTGGKARASEIW